MSGSHPVRIAPSLLASDFARLADEVQAIEAAGADWLHVDVMDGHFVPNLTIGPPVVKAIAGAASVPLDVHLMIADPWFYADAFLDAGAHVLTFHYEVCRRRQGEVQALVDTIHQAGARAGLALNPDADVRYLQPFLSGIDMVLVMSVFPGFGGQRFLADVLPKVAALRDMGFRGDVEMDGGLDPETVPLAAAAGVNVFVAGTAIFGAPDRAARIQELRALAEAHLPSGLA